MIALARINRWTSSASFSPAAPCNSVHPIKFIRTPSFSPLAPCNSVHGSPKLRSCVQKISAQPDVLTTHTMARRPPSAAIGPLLSVLCIAAIAFIPAAIAFAPCVGLRCASPLPTSQARRPPSLTRILALDPSAAAAALGSTHAAAKRLILESIAVVRPH